MDWLWYTLAALAGTLVLLVILAAVIGSSAQRGGWGLGFLQRLQGLLLRFPLTRKWVLRSTEKALEKAATLSPDLLKTRGIDPATARQAQEMLSSMSEEGREKLLLMGTELDRDGVSGNRKQELMREASELIIDDLPLSREQRRRAERAQAAALRGASSPRKKSARSKGKKKR
jgi:hypothetical protein